MNSRASKKREGFQRLYMLFPALLAGYGTPAQAQTPSVSAFYQDIVSRQQAVNNICISGIQWNLATGRSYYSYLSQRAQEAWQRSDAAMVNRYRAEGMVAQRYCRGIF
jgi:hypothetical protein